MTAICVSISLPGPQEMILVYIPRGEIDFSNLTEQVASYRGEGARTIDMAMLKRIKTIVVKMTIAFLFLIILQYSRRFISYCAM
ncbi:hypothetical protein ES703_103686 [subsurface metagenome]